VTEDPGSRGSEEIALAPSLRAHLGETLPWHLRVSLCADVRGFALADLLGVMHGAGTAGLVHLRAGEHAKSIWLHRGEVVFASSNQRVDRLGECLIKAGVITLEQLREAERRFSPPDRFGKALVERGFLTPRELWHGVRYQVEEIVRSVFSYGAGLVVVFEGELQPDNVVRLSLPTRRLVAEGIQRRDELMRFLAMLQDPHVALAAVGGREAHLAGPERLLHEALAQESRFPELCERVGLDPLAAARALQLLRVVGAVRVVRSRDEGPYLGEADLRAHDDAARELVRNYVKLLAELAAPIVAVDGDGALRERLQRIVDEAAARNPEMLRGVRVGAGASLDPETLAERALQLEVEREPRIAAALGELVAYLEFELLNHPSLPDAEGLLSSLASLRAELER
jgi:hypothetical protein